VARFHQRAGHHPGPWIERLGLPAGIAERPLAGLSTGELLRLTLALLLAGEPRVLLLDEPTAPLDPRRTGTVEQAILEQAAAGTAVLWVSHDPEQARRMGDCLYRLEEGQLAGPYRDPEVYAELMPREDNDRDT
jgi:ABC-type multidrug transport system ATPase subunit